MTPQAFWQSVYVAAIRAGYSTLEARTRANAALADLEQCPAGLPREEWAPAVREKWERV